MTRTRLALLVVLAGILAGAVGAVALPRTGASAPTPPRLDVARIAPPPTSVPGVLDIDIVPGSRRILLRAADPAGGPTWALETLRGRYRLPADVPRRQIGKELFGLRTCLRLGRIVDGRFGWLDGSGTFRPAESSGRGAPTRCQADGPEGVARYEQTTWVSHPTFGPAVPLAKVIWGAADGRLDVRVRHGRQVPTVRQDGAFIAFAPPAGATPRLAVTSTSSAGETTAIPPDDQLPGRRGVDARLGAQAPDPEGGAPYGVSVSRRADGRWCYGNDGRVVDGRVGLLDAYLDTFFDQTDFTYQCGPRHPIKAKLRTLTRARPLSYTFSTGGPAGPASAGRIALRTLAATTVFAGITRADVRTIRVTTPTQTRVLRPSGPAHAFVAAFNGDFPSGRIRFDVTYTDGTTAHQTEDPSL